MEFYVIPAIYIGGSLFFLVILLAGKFTQSYSHKNQSISELGIPGSSFGWLVRWVGFVPLGISFMVFAIQSRDVLLGFIPFLFFIFTGVAILLAGIFPTDPDNRQDTTSGKIHARAVVALLLLLNAAPFIFSISALYRDPPERGFLVFSFSMGVLLLIFLVHSSTDIFLRLKASIQKASDVFKEARQPLLGLQQRILLMLHYIWWFVFIRVLADDGVFHVQVSTVHILQM